MTQDALRREQWTPINTTARAIVEALDGQRMMRIEVGPGGKRREVAVTVVERWVQVCVDEGYAAGHADALEAAAKVCEELEVEAGYWIVATAREQYVEAIRALKCS